MSQVSARQPGAAERAALDLLREGERFVLTGHMRPDGDCIGAQAALADLLRSLGKDVWIFNPDPVEPQFRYLEEGSRFEVWSPGKLPRHDVAVLLDCSELSRCGALADELQAAPSKKLVIDHHIHEGEAWWDEAYVDVKASASGLLVHRIATDLGLQLGPVGCAGVFTSIVTDTGWFKYSNTDAETLRVAGELVAGGVAPDELYGAIYQRKRRRHPRDTGEILSSLEYFADDRLAVVCAPRRDGSAAATLDGDDALDIVRSVGCVEVVLFLRELEDGLVKLSARSKTDYDVNRLARGFGGGGHRKASGATIEGSLEDVRQKLIDAACEVFEIAGRSAG